MKRNEVFTELSALYELSKDKGDSIDEWKKKHISILKHAAFTLNFQLKDNVNI